MVDPQGRPQPVLARDTCRNQTGAAVKHSAPLPATVGLDEDLRAAVSIMFMHDVRWLACVDGDGVFAGYITQPGITRLLRETYRAGVEAVS